MSVLATTTTLRWCPAHRAPRHRRRWAAPASIRCTPPPGLSSPRWPSRPPPRWRSRRPASRPSRRPRRRARRPLLSWSAMDRARCWRAPRCSAPLVRRHPGFATSRAAAAAENTATPSPTTSVERGAGRPASMLLDESDGGGGDSRRRAQRHRPDDQDRRLVEHPDAGDDTRRGHGTAGRRNAGRATSARWPSR